MGKRATKSKAKRMEEVVANSVTEQPKVSAEEQAYEEQVQRENTEDRIPADENQRPEQMADAESDMEGSNKKADAAPMEGDEEQVDPERNSVVKAKFKHKYIENAKAQGLTGKAARRSNWDWLSQQLATFCLTDKGKIDIGAFKDVLDANGVDHSKWTNQNKGWEGRFRMTGRVALQKVVANAGVLKWPDGSEMEVPADFVTKFKTKA